LSCMPSQGMARETDIPCSFWLTEGSFLVANGPRRGAMFGPGMPVQPERVGQPMLLGVDFVARVDYLRDDFKNFLVWAANEHSRHGRLAMKDATEKLQQRLTERPVLTTELHLSQTWGIGLDRWEAYYMRDPNLLSAVCLAMATDFLVFSGLRAVPEPFSTGAAECIEYIHSASKRAPSPAIPEQTGFDGSTSEPPIRPADAAHVY